MVHLDEKIAQFKREIDANTGQVVRRIGEITIPPDLHTVYWQGAELETKLDTFPGSTQSEIVQLLRNVKGLREALLENRTPHINYQFVATSQYGGFQVNAATIEEAQKKYEQWKETQIILEPAPEPDPSVLSGLGSSVFQDVTEFFEPSAEVITEQVIEPVAEFFEPAVEVITEQVIEPVAEFFEPAVEVITEQVIEPVTEFFEPEPEVTTSGILPPLDYEKWNVKVVHVQTGVVAYEGLLQKQNIEQYVADPNYNIVYLETEPEVTTVQVEPSIEPEPEVTTVQVEPPIEPEPEPLTWYHVKKPSGSCEFLNVSQKFVNQMTSQGWIFSLNDICYEPPTPTPTPTPTEPGQVNWIPEPFFSFINNVFRR